MADAFERRLTRVETIVEGLARETGRTQDRLRALEDDRGALRLAIREMGRARADLRTIAEEAARRALERRRSWQLRLQGFRVQVASVAVAAASLLLYFVGR
jgi:anti-sigma-K factor RskA